MRCPQVLLHPALVADFYSTIDVAVIVGDGFVAWAGLRISRRDAAGDGDGDCGVACASVLVGAGHRVGGG